jgi:hypothetical protein
MGVFFLGGFLEFNSVIIVSARPFALFGAVSRLWTSFVNEFEDGRLYDQRSGALCALKIYLRDEVPECLITAEDFHVSLSPLGDESWYQMRFDTA